MESFLDQRDLIKRMKLATRGRLDFFYMFQNRLVRDENLKNIDKIILEIIDGLCKCPVYRDASRHILFDGYCIPEKYTNILNEIQTELIKWFQKNGFPKSFVEIKGLEIIVWTNL